MHVLRIRSIFIPTVERLFLAFEREGNLLLISIGRSFIEHLVPNLDTRIFAVHLNVNRPFLLFRILLASHFPISEELL